MFDKNEGNVYLCVFGNHIKFHPAYVLQSCDPDAYGLALAQFADSGDKYLYDTDLGYFVLAADVLDRLESVGEVDSALDDLERENRGAFN
jgi:hypothetical protein